MNTTDTVSSLNFVTLGIGVVIALAVLLFFLRKRSNRHPLEGKREENIAQRLDAMDADGEEVRTRR